MNKRVSSANIFINIFFLLLGVTFYFVGSYVGTNIYAGIDGLIIATVFFVIKLKCPAKLVNYIGVLFLFTYLVVIEISTDAFTQEYALFLFGALLISLHSEDNLIRIYLILNFIYYVISFIVLLIIHGPQDYMISQLVHGIILISGLIITFFYVASKNASERSFFQESQNFQDLLKVVDAKKKTAMQATKAKGDFLASMSHEIRTPMNAIIGMSDLANKEDMTPQAREYLYRIKQSGRSLLSIINDILDYSKIESGKMEIIESEYSPARLIDNVAGIINTRIDDKHIELIVNYNPKIPKLLYGDEMRITQILINLVNNAVKFTDTGYVALMVDFGLADNGIMLRLKVSDTGIGIKKEDLLRIFSRFEQADTEKNKSVEGTGLGLAICRSLVEAMGGRLTVESEYGRGSEFSFDIFQRTADYSPGIKVNNPSGKYVGIMAGNPYIKGALVSMMSSLGVRYRVLDYVEDSNDDDGVNYIFCNNEFSDEYMNRIYTKYSGSKIFVIAGNEDISIPDDITLIRKPLLCQKVCACLNDISYSDYFFEADSPFDFIAPDAKILVVDDNIINLKVACGLLKPLQIAVDTASSGEEALNIINTKRYDIIFMDQMMPGMDGIETVNRIRSMDTEYYQIVPIIALTANATSGVQEMFIRKGFNGYLAKPVEFSDMSKVIKDWLPAKKIVYSGVTQSEQPEQNNAVEIHIEGLNITGGIQRSGSPEIYFDILKDFAQTSEMKIDRIIKCASDNLKDYITEVHGLKSTALLAGADDLSELAKNIEALGIYDEKDMYELINQYMQIAARITDAFGEEKHDVTAKLSNKEVLSMLTELGEQLVYYNIDEADRIMANLIKGTDEGENIKHLEEALFNADYEGAIKIIDTIKKCGEL